MNKLTRVILSGSNRAYESSSSYPGNNSLKNLVDQSMSHPRVFMHKPPEWKLQKMGAGVEAREQRQVEDPKVGSAERSLYKKKKRINI